MRGRPDLYIRYKDENAIFKNTDVKKLKDILSDK